MKPWKRIVVCILTTLYLPLALAESPVGLWTTVDDKTGETKAIVNLTETEGVLTGTIVKVYAQPGDKRICFKCPDHFKDKPIVGLQFLWDLKDRGDGVWDDGKILDARSGHIYHAKIIVKEDKLYVRGYLGFSLIGRTQVWIR